MSNFFRYLSRHKYEKKQHEIEAARRSLYYWWWRYLRLSEDYWWLCQQNGKTSDKEFRQTYELFGEVHESEFDAWWTVRGTKLFSYVVAPPRVQFVDPLEFRGIGFQSRTNVCLIPTHLTRSEILNQLSALLVDHVPQPLSVTTETGHEIDELRGIRKRVLIDAHRAWCLDDALDKTKKTGLISQPSRFTQHWIGSKLNLTPKKNLALRSKEAIEKYERLAMSVKVNRYIAKANNIIANVEIGHFPVVQPVAVRKRWTKSQAQDKVDAVDAGMWVCPESDTDEFVNMILG